MRLQRNDENISGYNHNHLEMNHILALDNPYVIK